MTALVTKHLPLVAGAPDGVKKLRALILDLAVRGKLVGQCDDEESASVLLKKLTSPICDSSRDELSPDVFPYELPHGWAWARLKTLATLITSGSRDWAKYYSDDGAIFVRMGNLSKDSYTLRLENIQRVKPPASGEGSRTRLEADDLLISITGDVGLLGLIPEDFGEAYINQHTCLVRFCDEVKGRFFPEVLRSPLAMAQYAAPQRGIKNSFRLSDVADMLVPVPPLAEQHRIVTKVDELMALCDRLEADQADAEAAHAQLVQALLDSLTQATDVADFRASWQRLSEHFHTLFTTEASIDALKQTVLQLAVKGKLVPQLVTDLPARDLLRRKKISANDHPHVAGWAITELGALGSVLGGATPSKANSSYWVGEIPWVSPKDMKRPIIDDAEDHVSSVALEQSSLKVVPPKSILMVVRGMILAHSFPVAVTARTVTINQDMKALVPPSEIADYLLMFLQASKAEMVALVDRSSHGTCKLVSEKLWSFKVCLPPLDEQNRIVAKVDELMALCDQLKAHLAETREQHAQLATALVEQAVA